MSLQRSPLEAPHVLPGRPPERNRSLRSKYTAQLLWTRLLPQVNYVPCFMGRQFMACGARLSDRALLQ